ncbi:MAG: AraC family transcriptional regulator [Ginsengibacter sp.]
MSALKIKKTTNTTNFVSAKPGLQNWLLDFSAHLNMVTDSAVELIKLPEDFANGFAKVVEIENGLTYRIVNYQLNSTFNYKRKPTNSFYLIIYFYQYTNCSKLLLEVNDIPIVDNTDEKYSSIVMTNSFSSQKLIVGSGTNVQGLTLQISEEWLKEKISHPSTSNYCLFSERDVFQSFLNPKSQKLLNEIFAPDIPSNLPELYINNRILRLLEDFLEKILSYGTAANTFPTSNKDAQNILRIESYLLENYHKEFPSIEKLAKMAFMSPTKLKTIFKKAFGMGLYEYYQKNRIHKAKGFLQTGEFSVSEVGEMIGYLNMSNFSNAFKKEFGQLPKDVNKIS